MPPSTSPLQSFFQHWQKLSIVFLLNLLYRSLCFSYHTIMSEYSELIPTYKSIKESANQLGLEFDVE